MVDILAVEGDERRVCVHDNLGEPPAGFDPGVSEWGNPFGGNTENNSVS